MNSPMSVLFWIAGAVAALLCGLCVAFTLLFLGMPATLPRPLIGLTPGGRAHPTTLPIPGTIPAPSPSQEIRPAPPEEPLDAEREEEMKKRDSELGAKEIEAVRRLKTSPTPTPSPSPLPTYEEWLGAWMERLEEEVELTVGQRDHIEQMYLQEHRDVEAVNADEALVTRTPQGLEYGKEAVRRIREIRIRMLKSIWPVLDRNQREKFIGVHPLHFLDELAEAGLLETEKD